MNGIICKNLSIRTCNLKPGIDIVPEQLFAVHLLDSVVRADTLKKIGSFWMFQPLGKLHLPGKDYGKKVSRVVLHVREKTQAFKVGR